LPKKRSDIPVSWPGAVVDVVPEVVVVAVDPLVDAAEVRSVDAAPPGGDVGLVGASVHAAVAAAHTRPSQARAIRIDIVQNYEGPGGCRRTPGGESGIVTLVLRSHRVPGLTANRLSVARNALQNQGISLVDVTGSNPTRAGFHYPDDLLAGLGGAAGLDYAPDPRGLRTARQAVSGELARHGVAVDPARILLTASTSEAYAFLFKVLCDPGDEVLVPVPSYPLFEILSRLEAVRAVPYPLDPHGGWSYDVAAVADLVTPRTRAVVVVSPNNPTGTVLRSADVQSLSAVCGACGLTLIADEVFADYRFAAAGGLPSTVLRDATCLTVSLGGLSKAVGLPQLKLAWLTVGGPEADAADLLDRLELVADSFLSVGTPIQAALPVILERGAAVREQIRARLDHNLAVARRLVAAAPAIQLLEPGGGWTAVLRVPATASEEALALDLLERHHVVVQPGYFYDFPTEAWLVVSLLTEPEAFACGMERIVAATAAESDKIAPGAR
jgi:alanine-synthesizing transaminase